MHLKAGQPRLADNHNSHNTEQHHYQSAESVMYQYMELENVSLRILKA